MKKLAIISSHPIQYNAPLFRLLTERNKIALKVFYTWGQTAHGFVYDPDFKKEFKWDIPLQDGYEKEFVENSSPNPGAGHFKGIMNKDLIQRVEQYQPDALLVYGWSFKSHLEVLRYFKGKIKIIFRGDSTLLDEEPGFSFKKVVRRIFLKWVYRHIDLALYTGKDNKDYFLAHGLQTNQLYAAPHAVDNRRFFETNDEFEQKAITWRRELGIPETAIVFLFAGKLESKKDPQLLIDSFKKMEDPSIRLLIVGNGVLEKEVKRNSLTDQRILFLDFQNQQLMPVVYRLANVFVLPSKGPGETWGLSVNEAMACGLPVLVSDRCGCAKELVKNNGRVFQAGNIDELLAAFHFFINNKTTLAEMGKISLSDIQNFSFNQIATVLEELV